MPNSFSNIMQQMQKTQSSATQLKEELAKEEIVGEAGAGMVKITCNGEGKALTVEIDDSVYQEAKMVLEDLIAAAMNDVNSKQKRLKEAKLKEMMTAMGLPANLGFPFGQE